MTQRDAARPACRVPPDTDTPRSVRPRDVRVVRCAAPSGGGGRIRSALSCNMPSPGIRFVAVSANCARQALSLAAGPCSRRQGG